MDPRDRALQASAPCIMVPKFGDFEPMTTNGHRFLVAEDGLWFEVKREWCYCRRRLAAQSAVPMPYGKVTEALEWQVPEIPESIIAAFASFAREACPLEAAAWVVWDTDAQSYDLLLLQPKDASAESIFFDRPRLKKSQTLILDLHSHGLDKAYFSDDDNADDCRDVKISGVIGCCGDQQTMTRTFRFCAFGLYIPLDPGRDGA